MSTYYTITVRGKQHEWVFPIMIDPKYLIDWRADGLIIDEVVAVQPDTVWNLKYWLAALDRLSK